MSAGKPYLNSGKEYLEQSRIADWVNDRVNPSDLAEYSEFQKPYALDKENDNYPDWEWTWPDWNWPPIPDVTIPDPVPNPCSVDEDCVWAGIIGPDTLECGKCYPYTQAHLYIGCDIAPYWAAFGSWELSGGNGDCYLLFGDQTSLIATVCCDDAASAQTLSLCYNGPLNCTDCISIIVECDECCEDFTLTGNDTVNRGSTWTGTIDPACPGATCEVVSNSGCELTCEVNGTGSQVTVATGGGQCGGFTVTVTDAGVGAECSANSASKHVRMIGGNGTWRYKSNSATEECGGAALCNDGGLCGCGYGSSYPYSPCVLENELKYGLNNGATFDCSQNYGYSCLAGTTCTCGASYPGCGGGASCGDPGPACSNPPSWCTAHVWHVCEWRCANSETCS